MPDGGVLTIPAIISLIGAGIGAAGVGVSVAGAVTAGNQQRAANQIQNDAEIQQYKLQQQQFANQRKQLAEAKTNLAQDLTTQTNTLQSTVATKAATSGFLNSGSFKAAESTGKNQLDTQYSRQLSQLSYQEQTLNAQAEQARIAREANQALFNQGLAMNDTSTFFNAAAAGFNGISSITNQVLTGYTNNWWVPKT